MIAGRITFAVACPNGHDPSQEFDFDRLQIDLARDAVTFSCMVCGELWKPTSLQKADLWRRVVLASVADPRD